MGRLEPALGHSTPVVRDPASLRRAAGEWTAYYRRMETQEPAPESGSPLVKAVDFLEKGEWQPAHEIVQGDKSNLAAWLHGIVHTLEGDLDNARYWYRRAGRDFPGVEGVQREIASARRRVTR
jgi:hypothetical protein